MNFSDDYYINHALRTTIIHLDSLESKGEGYFSIKAELVQIYQKRTKEDLYQTRIGKKRLIEKRGYEESASRRY